MVTDMVVLFEPIQPPIQTSLPPFLEFKWLVRLFLISVGVWASTW